MNPDSGADPLRGRGRSPPWIFNSILLKMIIILSVSVRSPSPTPSYLNPGSAAEYPCIIWDTTVLYTSVCSTGPGVNTTAVLKEASRRMYKKYNFFDCTLQIEEFDVQMENCIQCQPPKCWLIPTTCPRSHLHKSRSPNVIPWCPELTLCR